MVCSVRTSTRLRIFAAVGALLIAVVLAAQPLDSGDNFCGNAFVSRGSNHRYNGCDVRLAEQRAGAFLIALAGVGLLVATATRPRQ
jgi:hypothetical protein